MELRSRPSIIMEFSEFNAMRMGSDSVPQSTHVDNPSLSMDSYNRYELNMKGALSKLDGIFKKISRTTTGINLHDGSTLELTDFKQFKILRIFAANDIYFNIYFSFTIEEEEYFGVIEKINSPNPNVKCELFRDLSVFGSKEWIIRIKGMLVKSIRKWLDIDLGNYKLLKDLEVIDKNSGSRVIIPINSEIEVTKSNDNYIELLLDEKLYFITNNNYFYFNYYFVEN